MVDHKLTPCVPCSPVYHVAPVLQPGPYWCDDHFTHKSTSLIPGPYWCDDHFIHKSTRLIPGLYWCDDHFTHKSTRLIPGPYWCDDHFTHKSTRLIPGSYWCDDHFTHKSTRLIPGPYWCDDHFTHKSTRLIPGLYWCHDHFTHKSTRLIPGPYWCHVYHVALCYNQAPIDVMITSSTSQPVSYKGSFSWLITISKKSSNEKLPSYHQTEYINSFNKTISCCIFVDCVAFCRKQHQAISMNIEDEQSFNMSLKYPIINNKQENILMQFSWASLWWISVESTVLIVIMYYNIYHNITGICWAHLSNRYRWSIMQHGW